MDAIKRPHCQRKMLGFVLLIFLLGFIPTDTCASTTYDQLRYGFLLGFTIGNGHLLYLKNPQLGDETRAVYREWMEDAQRYGEKLGVTIDMTPPPANSEDPIKTAVHQHNIMGISLASRHSRLVLAADKLGYNAALSIMYIPYLSPQAQRDAIKDNEELANVISLPLSIMTRYNDVLTTTRDKGQLINAMFQFKNDTLRHYEGLVLDTPEGARRQLNVWMMGWKLGLATLGQTRGADPALVNRMFEECRAFADALGVSLVMLPEASTDSARDTATAIQYLLNEAGDHVGGQLTSFYGPHANGLYELALKSTLSLILYSPDDDGMSLDLASVVERSGRKAGLPSRIYYQVVQKMRTRASYPEVKSAIKDMDNNIETYYLNLSR